MLDLSDFFLKQGLGWPIVSRFHETLMAKDELTKDLFYWPALKRSFLGNFYKWIFNLFPLAYPHESLLKKEEYEFIINTHNSEPSSVLISRAANKQNIPVVCMPLGLDNIMHGPLLFTPDLMLFWGEEQENEFKTMQIPWNNSLSETKTKIVGCLIYDNFFEFKQSKDFFYEQYDLREDEKIILFPVHIEDNHPGQISICKTIVSFIEKNKLSAKLMVRLRPNFDIDMWKEFQKDNPNKVILQIPKGVSFDKSSSFLEMDIEIELNETEIFASSFSSSSVVVGRALSTTYTDSIFLGTQTIIAQYYDDKKRTKVFQRMFDQVCTFYPYYKKGYEFAFSEEELIEFLERNLLDNPEIVIEQKKIELLKKQVGDLESKSGLKAITAINEFFE